MNTLDKEETKLISAKALEASLKHRHTMSDGMPERKNLSSGSNPTFGVIEKPYHDENDQKNTEIKILWNLLSQV